MGSIGAPELLIVLAIVVLIFGASKLPDLARGSGRALRIFKAETKGLIDEDDKTPRQKELEERERDFEAREKEREAEFERRHPVNRNDEPGTPGPSA